jgi:pilus assembly protein CpaC
MSFIRKSLRPAAIVMLSAAACLPLACTSPLRAMETAAIDTQGDDQQDARFLRIGIAKTAVIKLPANVKDVIIGDNAIADVVLRNQDTAYLFARAAGQTNVFFFDDAGRELMHLEIEVMLDGKGLKRLLDRSMPGNRIEVDSIGANVVLKGTVASAADAKTAFDLANRFLSPAGGGTVEGVSSSIVNMLQVAQGDQVALKVRVVELKRTLLKQLGVNITADVGAANFSTIPLTGRATQAFGEIGLALGGNSIDVTLQALEEQDLATTLAEPTLTAISGAQASFVAGGEFGYRSCPSGVVSATCTVAFRPYGVTLGFTPTVLSEGRIALNISTEVSELGNRIDGIPEIDTRRAQTSVEIPSGGSMMMAGLIKNVSTQELRGTPGLRTLPVLGALFSSRDYQANQTELVVIVTPYIVNSVRPDQIATPLDNFNPPTDLQQIFLGRLNRVYGAPADRPAGVYHGQVGHIVE